MREFLRVGVQAGASRLKLADGGCVFLENDRGLDEALVSRNQQGRLVLRSDYYTLAKMVLVEMGVLRRVRGIGAHGKVVWRHIACTEVTRDVRAWERTVRACALGKAFGRNDTRRRTWAKKDWCPAAVAFAIDFVIDMMVKTEVKELPGVEIRIREA